MSKSGETLYNLSLKHLSRDGRQAGADLPPVDLSFQSARQFRAVLEAMESTAAGVVIPAEPELRVTTVDGNFVVKAKAGKLHLTSWSSRHKGGEYSAARILAIITGAEEKAVARARAAGGGPDWLQGKAGMVLMVAAIILINSFTIWFVTRPKRTLVPKYTLLPAEPAARLLADVAGAYETGASPGDRRIEIDKDGAVQRYKFGPERTPTVKQTFTVQAAEAQGAPALVTSRKALITIKDQLTVVLYGDKYKRVAR
jgi:hypothetical protein